VVREQIKRPDIRSRRLLKERQRSKIAAEVERKAKWKRDNPEKSRRAILAWKAANAERARESARLWRERNRERVREKQRRADARLQKDPAHVLKKRIKARLRQMLKGVSLGATEKILGYSRQDMVTHIERQFSPGMSWDRLMKGEIHIDHIRPVSSFLIQGIGCPEFIACWSLSNLRPMWAIENQLKGSRIVTLL